jgi:hypothetical protein
MDTQARINILWGDNLNDLKSTHRTMMHVLDAMMGEIRELRAEVETLKKCGQSFSLHRAILIFSTVLSRPLAQI